MLISQASSTYKAGWGLGELSSEFEFRTCLHVSGTLFLMSIYFLTSPVCGNLPCITAIMSRLPDRPVAQRPRRCQREA